MSPMDPRARVGDAEREETVTALERYASDGYLSLDEFSERSAAAYRATTYGELARLTGDLTSAEPERNRGEPERNRGASKLTRPGSWSPAAIVVAAVVGVVLVAAIVMAMMMIGMGSMGGMMEDMR